MKKICLFAIALIISTVSFAKHVNIEVAHLVASNFWTMKSHNQCPNLIEISDRWGVHEMYIFATMDNNGFIIVASDDIANPILGYSLTNGIINNELPANLEGWLQHYSEEIKSARNAGYQGCDETETKWFNLINNIDSESGSNRKSVAPLVQTYWDQGSPYNNLCPLDINNRNQSVRSVTGCAATAMAQVLRYWNWPLKGNGTKTYTCTSLSDNAPEHEISADFGNTTYSWNIMPTGSANYSWTATQKNAVATLMFHCGVSLEMEYSYVESSAYSSAYPTALKTNFCYNNQLNLKYKQYYSETNWKSMVKNEIDAKRPLLYRGSSEDGTGGHAFVCDGYDAEENFHFNWGWSNLGDGYYPVSSLTPTRTGTGAGLGDYTYNQAAVFNLMPSVQTNNSFTLNNTSVAYGSTLSGTCGFRNTGTVVFNGYIGVAAYNSSDEFVTILAQTDQITFNGNTNKTVSINHTISSPLTTGEYTAKAVCSINGTTWYPIVVGYNNCATEVPFTVTGENPEPQGEADIKICQGFSLNNSSYTTGNMMTGTCGFKNVGDGTFTGKIGIAAYTASGTLVTMLNQTTTSLNANASANLAINHTVAAPLVAGTYVARPVYSTDNGSSWNIVNTSSDGTSTMIVFNVTQPSTGDSELKVCNNFAFINNSITAGETLVGSCGICNTGTGSFSGIVGVAAYTMTNTIVDILDQQSTTINSNSTTSVAINYTLTSAFEVGTYIAKAVYSTDNGASWNVINTSNDNTSSMVVFYVTNSTPSPAVLKVGNLELYNSSYIIELGQQLIGSCEIRNTGSSTFNGQIGVAAYTDDDQLVAVMCTQNAVMTEDATRTPSFSYTIENPFTIGDYAIRAVYSTNNGVSWNTIDASYQNQPTQLFFSVIEPQNNNSITQSDTQRIAIFSSARNIVIKNALGLNAIVVDIMGRTEYNSECKSDNQIIAVTHPGIFVVKIGDNWIKKIIVR